MKKLTAFRKFVDIFNAGSVTAGIAADKQVNTDLGLSPLLLLPCTFEGDWL